MNIIVHDNQFFLPPFSINHASFELKIGLFSNLDRIRMLSKENDSIYLIVRKEIEEIIKERFPNYSVNPKNIPDGIHLKGEIPYKKIEKSSDENQKLFHLIDIMKINQKFLSFDFQNIKFDKNYSKHDSVILINKTNIKINKDTNIKAGVIIDAEQGKVVIGKNVLIDVGAIIQGPTFINNNSYIAPGAKIRSGSFIGENCKVGGEISNSIISNYSNKVHDGFLGHSFVGEWVNIGAGTNNSNLKNNYSSVKFDYGDGQGPVVTNEQFLGAFIGDYSKLGISTMLNTGTHIGIGSNVFGGNFQDKYIPPFSWGRGSTIDFNKFIETCKIMKARRNIKISDIEIDFLKKIYNKKS